MTVVLFDCNAFLNESALNLTHDCNANVDGEESCDDNCKVPDVDMEVAKQVVLLMDKDRDNNKEHLHGFAVTPLLIRLTMRMSQRRKK